MVFDDEKPHGGSAVLASDLSDRPQRPLTTEQKLGGTTVDNSTPIKQDNGILSKLRILEATMDSKLGIESQAIDRKLPEERQPVSWHSQLTMSLLWASGNMNIPCFAAGFLGWEFGLDLKQSILTCIFGSLLGGAVSGFCATLGAATGLRQISISRYSMGWYPNKIIALLNTIQQIGWSAVGCITGGVALNAVADGQVSTALGVVITAVCSLIVSFVGLRAILVYEKYAWFIYLIIFLIILGETGRYADNRTPTELTGADLSGTILSLLAIIYGSTASWATLASDYYVHYPANINRTNVFILTTLGIGISSTLGLVAGCVVGSGLNNRNDWHDTYENGGIGYLIQDMLYPHGFAKFLLVLLVLSSINGNIINTYSAAISCQQFARPFAKVPRFIWTFFCFCVILAIALAGRNQLLTYLQNFLALLGYWCTSYFTIVFSEHYLFRKGQFWNYDLEGWNDPSKLPLGIAGFAAFALGVVAWVMGMVGTWYVGPLGGMIGTSGGDIANQCTFVVTLLVYIPARHLELKYVGK